MSKFNYNGYYFSEEMIEKGREDFSLFKKLFNKAAVFNYLNANLFFNFCFVEKNKRASYIENYFNRLKSQSLNKRNIVKEYYKECFEYAVDDDYIQAVSEYSQDKEKMFLIKGINYLELKSDEELEEIWKKFSKDELLREKFFDIGEILGKFDVQNFNPRRITSEGIVFVENNFEYLISFRIFLTLKALDDYASYFGILCKIEDLDAKFSQIIIELRTLFEKHKYYCKKNLGENFIESFDYNFSPSYLLIFFYYFIDRYPTKFDIVHCTTTDNLDNMIKKNKIYSHNKLRELDIDYDNLANLNVLYHTFNDVKDYVRFYFNVDNPVYHIFVQKSNKEIALLHFSKKILLLDDIRFANGNSSKKDTIIYDNNNARELFSNFYDSFVLNNLFDEILSSGFYPNKILKSRRCAELQIFGEVDITKYLTMIDLSIKRKLKGEDNI